MSSPLVQGFYGAAVVFGCQLIGHPLTLPQGAAIFIAIGVVDIGVIVIDEMNRS